MKDEARNSIIQACAEIRKKLGVTGTHTSFPGFSYYTSAEGDYFTISLKDGLEVTHYSFDDLKITQDLNRYRTPEEIASALEMVRSSITDTIVDAAATRRQKEIEDLETKLKKLKEAK